MNLRELIIVIVIGVLLFALGFSIGLAVGLNKKITDITEGNFFTKTIVNEVDNGEQVEEKKDYPIDKYKLLDDTKLNISKDFPQDVYKKIVDGIYNYDPIITVADADVEYCAKVAIENNIFVDLVVDSIKASDNKNTIEVKYKYKTKEIHEQKIKEAEGIIKDILINATENDANEFKKVLYVYSYLAKNIVYNSQAADSGKALTIEQVLYDHQASSKNYTLMVNYLLGQMGIQSYTAYGDTIFAKEHQWNFVKIYGNYYEVDVAYESANTQGKGLVYFGRVKQDILNDGLTFSEWVNGFVYEDYTDIESNKLQILRNAVDYKLDKNELIVYDISNNEYARIDTESLEILKDNTTQDTEE